MRRKLVWALVLPAVLVLAGPTAAAPRLDVGTIYGTVVDDTTGTPLPVGIGSALLSVDIYNVATMERLVRWVTDPAANGVYQFINIPEGTYKMRFRYLDEDGELTRYRWNANRAAFNLADPIVVAGGSQVVVNASLKPLSGAAVSGTLVERPTSTPLTTACYGIQLYEAGGIGLGVGSAPDASGNWEVPAVPAGTWTALATYSVGTFDLDGDGIFETDCGTSPAHLETWYRGAAGYPLFSGLVADAHTFSTANIFRVRSGVDVTGVTIAMLPAPLCRGRVPTIFGTTLDDAIRGTAGRDIIAGLRGNDEIRGLRGNDLLCGNEGDDLLIGGPGPKDLADGGSGTDVCDAERQFNCP